MKSADAVKDWARRAFTEDTGKPSTTRIATWVLGAAGIVFAFVHPDRPEMAMALLGASTGTSFGRTRSGGEG